MPTRVRLHAITTKGVTFDPAPDLARLNQVMAAADLVFAYDPNVDLERDATQDDSNEALVARASRYHGKVVVFYTARQGGQGLSNCIRMPKQNNTPFLAHELGHYFGLPHTFRHGVGTNTAAGTQTPEGLKPLTRAIKTAIEAMDEAYVVVVNPKTGEERRGRMKRPLPPEVIAHGREVMRAFMDGDNPPFTDTAPSIHEIPEADHERASKDDQFVIAVPVTFSSGQTHTYQFAPDRTNLMSYFFGSRHLRGLSPQQANVVSGSVSFGDRRHLVGAPLRWSPWVEVEGNGRTHTAPAAAAFGDRVFCFVKGTGTRIFVNSRRVGTINSRFGGWSELAGNGRTDAAPAAAAVGDRLFCFVKGNAGADIFVNSSVAGGPFGGWSEVQGEGETDTAPAAAAAGDRVFCIVKGKGGPKIFVNTAAVGRPFGGWSELEGGGETDVAPAAAAVGDRVFCFVKGNGGPRIFVNTAVVGRPFGGWSELPGGGETDAAPAAAAVGDRVFCFVKGNRGPRLFVNSATIGQPFTGWNEIPGIETDTTPAVAALGNQLHVFAKERNGERIFRATATLI